MKHKHKYVLNRTSWEFPVGTEGTSIAMEMAYLVCSECFKVKKQIVEQPKLVSKSNNL